jgi:hypothetical protein
MTTEDFEQRLRRDMWTKFASTVFTVMLGLMCLAGAMGLFSSGFLDGRIGYIFAGSYGAVGVFGAWRTFQAARALFRHRASQEQ